MTASMPPERGDSTRPARTRWAMVLALVSAPLLVVVVLAATWVAGADGTLPPPPETTEPLRAGDEVGGNAPGEEAPLDVVVPEGDYGEFCGRLRPAVPAVGAEVTVNDLVALIGDVDFGGLIDVAPPEIVGALEAVRDGQQDVAAQMADAGPDGRIDLEAIDESFGDGLALLVAVASDRCGLGGG